jgi:sporulation protein YlmC with PRC-barrel domain
MLCTEGANSSLGDRRQGDSSLDRGPRHFNDLQKGNAMNTDTLSSDVISSDRVEGTAVYNQAGDKLGSIDHLVIDKRSGQVRYAVLEFGGFLGMGTDRYPLPWNVLKYDTGKDGYMVPIDKAALEKAPRYGVDTRPTYDEAYGREVYGFYGASW